MKYITHRRFKQKAICGDVNLPAMTECEEINGMIYYDHKPICLMYSENAHQYFARNDDGNGMERGKLTQAIIARLALSPTSCTEAEYKAYQKRWDKVWDDPTCQAYKRTEHKDHWLWNHTFYNADIETLRYIAKLVGAKA